MLITRFLFQPEIGRAASTRSSGTHNRIPANGTELQKALRGLGEQRVYATPSRSIARKETRRSHSLRILRAVSTCFSLEA
jgi:hypothetical protein